jgi:hypothetical protein
MRAPPRCAGPAAQGRIIFRRFTARLRSPRFARLISGQTLKSCPDTCLVGRNMQRILCRIPSFRKKRGKAGEPSNARGKVQRWPRIIPTMLLTITTTHNPATDLGYLLHKNPERMHSFELSFGKAHLFYPEATPERCTAALLLDVDPVGLVRGKRGQHEGGTLDQYVNDRPYVLSSFLSVAMGRARVPRPCQRGNGSQRERSRMAHGDPCWNL